MPKESRILKIYNMLLDRLPATYPHATLVVHKSITELRNYYKENCEGDDEGDPPYAFCDSADNTIHVSCAFYNETIQSICWYYLHEIFHLFALNKYGENDPRWSDYEISERYANMSADRWIKKLKEEDWFANHKNLIV